MLVAGAHPRGVDLYVFGWPSQIGGADTRIAHTLAIWAEIARVTVVPNDRFRLGERAWVDRLAALGIAARAFDELPARLTGIALSMSNQRFFADRIAHRARDRGLRVVWSSEMMWHHPGELDAVGAGVVQCVLYTSEINRAALGPGYLARNPSVCQHVVENWIDPGEFPMIERSPGPTFTIGRLSRPDPVKYPEDFPVFYELLGLAHPRYRVMAWDAQLAQKYRWHAFGPEWTLLGAGAESQMDFLRRLDAFVYPLGHDFRESWGRSTVEAMLTGLPVVVPTGHHFSSYLRDGETGFLCADFDDFRRACRALEREPALRRRIGDAAARFAREVLCDRARHVDAWREVFHG